MSFNQIRSALDAIAAATFGLAALVTTVPHIQPILHSVIIGVFVFMATALLWRVASSLPVRFPRD
jgi:hypothetical protein